MRAQLKCFSSTCAASYPIDEVLYTCRRCGNLLEVTYPGLQLDPEKQKRIWLERRMSNAPEDQSGVWRYREMFPFLRPSDRIVTLREGNTALLDAPHAASYAGLDRLQFKHQGYNPTGSFKDNGMTAGVAQALRLGMTRVACVSTGNTSASMAAYASAAGLKPIIFLPHGNISFGKLSQALEYGAVTIQVKANFDQILALVRRLSEKLGIYLLNSVNPFRIEGQKSIMIELMDQRGWKAPDWIVVPGGNLGNAAAFGKALFEMFDLGFIDRLPRLIVVQADHAAPFHRMISLVVDFEPVREPETLATAIRIGDPVSWQKAHDAVVATHGLTAMVTEQQIADAKAVIGQCGIGCEPASATTLAALRELTVQGVVGIRSDTVAILTGHVLKDTDYIHRYHTGQLKTPWGDRIDSTFGNAPVVAPCDEDHIAEMLAKLE